jgi:hypothetical protein
MSAPLHIRHLPGFDIFPEPGRKARQFPPAHNQRDMASTREAHTCRPSILIRPGTSDSTGKTNGKTSPNPFFALYLNGPIHEVGEPADYRETESASLIFPAQPFGLLLKRVEYL